jgi:hypothetical protein
VQFRFPLAPDTDTRNRHGGAHQDKKDRDDHDHLNQRGATPPAVLAASPARQLMIHKTSFP